MIQALAVIGMVAVVLVLYTLRARPVALAFLALFVGHYLLDAALTGEHLYFTPTENGFPYEGESAMWVITSVLVAFVIATAVVVAVPRRVPGASGGVTVNLVGRIAEIRRLRLFFVLGGVVSLSVLVTARLIRVGISDVLALRTQYFGDSLPSLAVYFGAPVCGAIALAGAMSTRGHRRAVLLVVGLLCAAATVVSGSRSNFLLSFLLPVLHVRATAGGRRRLTWRRASSGLLVAGAALVTITAVFFAARGGVASLNPAESTDVAQYDSAIRQYELGEREPSYVAGLTWFVPRSVWSGKPLPGNAAFSDLLFAARYRGSGAEVTLGLIGEAHMNAGPTLAGPVAGALLATTVLVLERLLNRCRGNAILMAVALSAAYRAVNLIRGDFVNVVAPVSIAIVLVVLLEARTRTRRAPVAVQWA